MGSQDTVHCDDSAVKPSSCQCILQLLCSDSFSNALSCYNQ